MEKITLDGKILSSREELKEEERKLKEKIEKKEIPPSRIVEVSPGCFKTLQKLYDSI
jgi:transcription antitermination factor NusG